MAGLLAGGISGGLLCAGAVAGLVFAMKASSGLPLAMGGAWAYCPELVGAITGRYGVAADVPPFTVWRRRP